MNRNLLKSNGDKLILVMDDIYKSFFIIDKYVIESMSINIEKDELIVPGQKGVSHVSRDSAQVDVTLKGIGIFTTNSEPEFFKELGTDFDREELLKLMNAKLSD